MLRSAQHIDHTENENAVLGLALLMEHEDAAVVGAEDELVGEGRMTLVAPAEKISASLGAIGWLRKGETGAGLVGHLRRGNHVRRSGCGFLNPLGSRPFTARTRAACLSIIAT